MKHAKTPVEAEPSDYQCFTRYSSGDGQSVLRSDQSLGKVAFISKDANLNVLFDIRWEFSKAGHEQRISDESCHQPETDRDGGAGAVSELFVRSHCASVLTMVRVGRFLHVNMCWQTKRVTQSEAGGVWLEGSAQSALQRYLISVLFALTVVLWFADHAALPICVVVVSLDVIKEKGLEHVTVEDLVTVITPKGRGIDSTVQCMIRWFCMLVTVQTEENERTESNKANKFCLKSKEASPHLKE